MSGTHAGSVASPFRQPKAVFAVAFACVVSFMGIGLVDPILPAISNELHASPSEVTLLFTSYLVVTAVAMLITNWVSSRIGAKKTLIAGLILIVLFSAAAGASPSINAIIGFRAGWGVGNALFIATSLAVIVASASGGFAGAIVLYETALGVGIAIGPLLGGTLGEISWRGPFYGVAVLMAIALIATIVLVEPTPKPARKTGLSAPLRALKHRGLLTISLTALCYNWAFFTVLGYAPFPMGLSPIKLGLVFTGWGVLVAIFAVFGAPRLQASLGIARTMYANLAAFALVVLVIAIWTTDRAVLIPAVIISGIFIGVNNTVTTQAVMTVSPVEKPVASAAYSFVRFIGGGLAPYAAGRLVLAVDIHFPFYIALASVALVGVLAIVLSAVPWLARSSAVQRVIREGQDATGQTTLRWAMVLLFILLAFASRFGLDVVLGALLAGIVLRAWTRRLNMDIASLEHKFDAVGYGIFIPIFFISSGMGLDLKAISRDPLRLLLFFAMLLIVRGLPSLLVYRRALAPRQRLEMTFITATTLPLLIALAEIGQQRRGHAPRHRGRPGRRRRALRPGVPPHRGPSAPVSGGHARRRRDPGGRLYRRGRPASGDAGAA